MGSSDQKKEAYPLYWPEGFPRSRHRERSRFRTTSGRARDEMVRELERLGAGRIVISTNVQLRNDGLPYANTREPDDRGVAVYFRLDGEDMSLACDRWWTVQENMAAITHTIVALRGIDRWGCSDMLKRVFRGFAALPAPMVAKRSWREVMGFPPGLKPVSEQLKGRYRFLAKERHPDTGGSADQFAELEAAYREAQEELNAN